MQETPAHAGAVQGSEVAVHAPLLVHVTGHGVVHRAPPALEYRASRAALSAAAKVPTTDSGVSACVCGGGGAGAGGRGEEGVQGREHGVHVDTKAS